MLKFGIYTSGLVGLLFVGVGLWMFYSQVLRGRKQADAEILTAAVESFEQTNDSVTTTMYRTKYEIRYLAEGRYFTIPVRSTYANSRRAVAEKRLLDNPAGSRQPIYYLPDRPESVSLEPLPRRAGFAFLFLSVGVIILGFTAILWFSSLPYEW